MPRFKAPVWWWDPVYKPAAWLRGLAYLYTRLQQPWIHRQGQKAPCPVISIGNLTVGGAGKTPVVLWLAEQLQAWGYAPLLVTRGYGGRTRHLTRVQHQPPQEVGEEPLLLAKAAPTYVCPVRSQILSLQPFPPKTVILLDDAHQHTSLAKDLSFLVVNAVQGWGNGYVLPAGPLREPLAQGLARAQGVFYIRTPTDPPLPPCGLPIFNMTATFSCPLPPGQRVVGFCALGCPDRFLDTLEDLGYEVCSFWPLPDHYFYTDKDEAFLTTWAHHKKATLVTTAKDWVKLSAGLQQQTKIVHQQLHLQNPSALQAILWPVLMKGARP